MEKILELYAKPLNINEPVVCLDEKPIQLLKEKYPYKQKVRPGYIKKRDYEYIRKGTANIFCSVEPKAGCHETAVYKRKTGKDFARFIKKVYTKWKKAKVIHLIMDNYKTHKEKFVIDYFGLKEGAKIWNKFEVHYTPLHASWLNQAEIEISMCSSQCIGKRKFSKVSELRSEIIIWKNQANKKKQKINWEFTKKDARGKFGYK